MISSEYFLSRTYEQEIVLGSIRINHDQDERIMQILGSGLNWHRVTQYALEHGVLPLLYLRLKGMDPDLMPQGEMELLKKSFVINAQRNLRITRMLIRIANLFSRCGIRFIPLKGPTLAQQLYGDTSLRHFSDLDILIDERDFYRCNHILSDAGFLPNIISSRNEQSWMLRADTEFQYSFQGDLLELHWAIAERGVIYPLHMSDFWSNLETIDFYGQQMLSLSPENLLLMLCIHGTKHMWDKLAWVSDVAHFIQAYPDFNWSKLTTTIERTGFSRVVGLSLLLAEKLCGADIPSLTQSKFRTDPLINALTETAIENIFSDVSNSEGSYFMYYLKARERLRDRFYYIFDQVFIPKRVDWMMVSLPRVLYPLYYILRPIRLLLKFGSEMISLASLRKIT